MSDLKIVRFLRVSGLQRKFLGLGALTLFKKFFQAESDPKMRFGCIAQKLMHYSGLERKLMRAIILVIIMALLAPITCAGAEENLPKVDLAGSWLITWDANPTNVNPAKFSQSGDKIEGMYLNDASETCKVTGLVNREKGTVSLTIVGPHRGFEIKCDGLLVNAKLVEGSYFNFGKLKGRFRMSRDEK